MDMDVTKEEEVRKVFAEIAKKYGKLYLYPPSVSVPSSSALRAIESTIIGVIT